jgi:hypothetical protein
MTIGDADLWNAPAGPRQRAADRAARLPLVGSSARLEGVRLPIPRRRALLEERVRDAGLLARDVVVERFPDSLVEGRLSVGLQKPLDADAGQRLAVAGALLLPGLERLVVEEVRPPEGVLEVGLGVLAAEEVAPGPTSRRASMACPFSVMSTPRAKWCRMPSWSASITNFS